MLRLVCELADEMDAREERPPDYDELLREACDVESEMLDIAFNEDVPGRKDIFGENHLYDTIDPCCTNLVTDPTVGENGRHLFISQ